VRGEYSGSWLAFFPPSPPSFSAIGLTWEVVSSYSSATASGFHGIPRIHTHRYKSRKELGRMWVGSGGYVKAEKIRNPKSEIRKLFGAKACVYYLVETNAATGLRE
jgi:hypothetical protein